MNDLYAEIDSKEYMLANTSLLKLSRLLLNNKERLSMDQLLEFNKYLQEIENFNTRLNRQMVRRVHRYTLLN